MNHFKRISLLILIFVTIFLRFDNLGYSHFYGDETKTFYLDKTKPALEFFLNQRKGPVQFLVSWIVEKITGGYSELNHRIPFAMASSLAVLVFYYLAKKIFENEPKKEFVAILAAYLFSISGFFIAFGRTVQYQSFLILFGLLAILLFINKKTFLSGVSLGLAFLSHYDAIFYLFPILVIAYEKYKKDYKVIISFIFGVIIFTAPFYLTYFFSGNFQINTAEYLNKRISGKDYLPNNSLLTFNVYNPNFLYFLLLSFSSFSIIDLIIKAKVKNYDLNLVSLLLWFLIPFLLFELIFSNPGTHILNYIIPIIILASYGIIKFYEFLKNKTTKYFGIFLVSLGILLVTITQIRIFTPTFNNGYPWNTDISKTKNQLFLYGFPYNRNWQEINNYLKNQKDFNNFYTNDDIDVALFYLHPKDFYEVNPTYFISISKNQQYKEFDEYFNPVFNYTIVKEISQNGKTIATIYQRGNRK